MTLPGARSPLRFDLVARSDADEVARDQPASRPPSSPSSPAAAGSWHYDGRRRSWKALSVALLVSAALHAALLFGFGRHRSKTVARAPDENLVALTITMPEIKELEEPDPAPSADADGSPEITPPAPMQADRPSIALPSDFVQALDFASLIERPDLSAAKTFTIPEYFGRGSGKIGEGLGNIFALADLDTTPSPTFQPAPVYPASLKSRLVSGIVKVEFIVDAQGRVRDATVVETTNPGFDAATLAAVAKWKFTPGVRAGRKVNTRMRVPITFSLVDPLDLIN